MKLFYPGNFDEREFEGSIKIARSIVDHFSKKYGSKKVGSATSADIVHSFSGGIWYKKSAIPGKHHILTLCSFQKANPVAFLYDYMLESFCFTDFEHSHKSRLGIVVHMIISTLSYCTPMFIKRVFFRDFDYIIVPLECLKEELGLPEKTRVIPFGVSIGRVNIDAVMRKRKDMKDNDVITVIYVGHTSGPKGLGEVIKAFAEIEARFLDGVYGNKKIALKIYLSEESRKIEPLIEKVRKKEGMGIIELHGYQKDLHGVYEKSDIIVLPFHMTVASIPVPLVLIEAMSHGLSVVTTDLKHTKEIAEDAVLYSKVDVSEIVENIEKLIMDGNLRYTLQKKSILRIMNNFHESLMFKGYEQLYAECIKEENEERQT